ncbi:MAG TPA: PilN domain-containing protein [Patescibacteria group bacterium]|nr:PilN domain-containing protein [Patescibacteria group bacterium]
MTASKSKIEFLPQEDWEKTPFGKFLKWLLTVGRYIVVFTELIVILAFISRFKLDRDLTDLYQLIEQKQAIIQASVDFETDFRFLQKQLTSIQGLRKEQLKTNQLLKEISDLTPIDVSFSNLTITGDKVEFKATALSEAGLATFIYNLKKSPSFTNLNIDSLSLGSEQGVGISFSLNSQLIK